MTQHTALRFSGHNNVSDGMKSTDSSKRNPTLLMRTHLELEHFAMQWLSPIPD